MCFFFLSLSLSPLSHTISISLSLSSHSFSVLFHHHLHMFLFFLIFSSISSLSLSLLSLSLCLVSSLSQSLCLSLSLSFCFIVFFVIHGPHTYYFCFFSLLFSAECGERRVWKTNLHIQEHSWKTNFCWRTNLEDNFFGLPGGLEDKSGRQIFETALLPRIQLEDKKIVCQGFRNNWASVRKT